MSDYWAKRAAATARTLYDKSLEQTQKELARQYKTALKAVKTDIGVLYDKLAAAEEISVNDLYKFDRFVKLQKRMNTELNRLGTEEVRIMTEKYSAMAEAVNKAIAAEAVDTIGKEFLLLDNDRVKEIINSVWCADGKHFSTRIWEDKKALQATLEKSLVDSVSRGLPKDEAVKFISKNFNTTFSNTDRIVRTELAHVQNTATRDTYKKAGIQYVETIVAEDERLCDECAQHNGKLTPIAAAREGVAYLFHPNCRCDILPIIE